MPNITVPISDLLPTVERPVIYDVVRQIQDRTGISSKTQVRYYGEDAKAQQFNSAIDRDETKHNLWPVVPNLTIEVEDDFNQDQILGIAVNQPDQPPIFIDEDIGVMIRPVYNPQDVVIRFKYKTRDRNEAIRWRNEFRTRVAINRQVFLHTVQFSYQFPEYYMGLLKSIWELSENIGGRGIDFDTWFKNHSTDKMTVLSNTAGNITSRVIAVEQVGVQGIFDIDGVPDKPQKEGDLDNWVINATYNFRYSKPINTVCFYPYLIHQQLVPEKYRFPTTVKNLLDEWASSTTSGNSFAYFQSDNQYLMRRANGGITIPDFEEFFPAFVPSTTLRVFTAAVGITPTDKRTLFNLKELDDYCLNPEILDFLQASEYSFLTYNFQSIFCLNLYQNEDILSDGILSVDANLNVVATTDLDLTKRYHLRLSLCGDMTYLTPDALTRLKAYPAVRDRLVYAINQALTNSGLQPDLRRNHLLPIDYALLDIPTGVGYPFGVSLVQTLFIEAKRLSDYKPVDTSKPIDIEPYFTNRNIPKIG